MLYAMARTDTTPIVRVPWNEPSIIGRVLDAGAYGVIIPMVNTAEEAAAAAVSRAVMRRVGSRSMGPVGVSARAGREGYFSSANDKVLCIPMIETKQAVEQRRRDRRRAGDRCALHRPGRSCASPTGLTPKADQDDAAVERGDRAGQGGMRAQR